MDPWVQMSLGLLFQKLIRKKVHPKDKPSFLHLYLGDIGDKYDLFWDVNTEMKISTTEIILVPVGWLINGNFVN